MILHFVLENSRKKWENTDKSQISFSCLNFISEINFIKEKFIVHGAETEKSLQLWKIKLKGAKKSLILGLFQKTSLNVAPIEESRSLWCFKDVSKCYFSEFNVQQWFKRICCSNIKVATKCYTRGRPTNSVRFVRSFLSLPRPLGYQCNGNWVRTTLENAQILVFHESGTGRNCFGGEDVVSEGSLREALKKGFLSRNIS